MTTAARLALLALALLVAPGCTLIRYRDAGSGASLTYLSVGTDRQLGPIRAIVRGDSKDVSLGAMTSGQSATAAKALDTAKALASPLPLPLP